MINPLNYIYYCAAAGIGTAIIFLVMYFKTGQSRIMKSAGNDIFGVEWGIESADRRALQKLKPLFELVKMPTDNSVKISTALSGSSTYMGRVNPYPGDLDITEIVLVRARGLHEAACNFVRHLQQNVEKALSTGRLRYLELKIGVDKNTGKSLKRKLDEVRRGKKIFLNRANVPEEISLCEAALQRQMIKLDLITLIEGNWKEVTKVYRFAYQPGSSGSTRKIVLLTPDNLGETIYQELYFSRAEAKLAAAVNGVSEMGGFSHPEVMKKYRDLMDLEIAHYGALGAAGKVSHLKLLKRWFNKLRMDHDNVSIAKLTQIFRSEINAVNELKEILVLLTLAVEKKLLTALEINDQLSRFHELISSRGIKMPEEDVRKCRQESRILGDKIEQGEWTVCKERLRSLSGMLESWIEEKAKFFLLKEILNPYAESLGIRLHDKSAFEHTDLFRGAGKGDRICYLINRYLRHDSRVIKRNFDKGEVIIQLGDEAASCYVIISGSAAVLNPREGLTSHHVRNVGPMTFIGEIALMHEGKRRTADIVARTKVEALEIPRDVFLELMRDKSFRLFIEFLTTDRLMEDGKRLIQDRSYNYSDTHLKWLKSSMQAIFNRKIS
jgi:hypothetical protein